MTLDITPFLPIISGAVGGATSVGLFKGPIQTFQDWWYVTFGYNQSNTAALLKAQQEINVKKLMDETLEETSKISPDNIQEPQLNILGPALESSKYYIEEDRLRGMFAKLIASSMDSSKINITHPSFVEIIKQMTSLDAQIFQIITNHENQNMPLCNIGYRFTKTGSYNILYSHIAPLFITLDDANHEVMLSNDLAGPSIQNLNRLGIVSIDYSVAKNNNTFYEFVENTAEYTETVKVITENNEDNLTVENGDNRIEFHQIRGVVQVTPFGNSFARICL